MFNSRPRLHERIANKGNQPSIRRRAEKPNAQEAIERPLGRGDAALAASEVPREYGLQRLPAAACLLKGRVAYRCRKIFVRGEAMVDSRAPSFWHVHVDVQSLVALG